MASGQIKISINKKEWQAAKELAAKECFDSPTAWIRHLIRSNSREV
jgi:hypothetical protein